MNLRHDRDAPDGVTIGTLRGQIRWAFAGKAGVRFAKRDEAKRDETKWP